MDILINLFVFCLVLFLYIHIYNHIKTSNYLEVYEIDNPSKEKFEELCELKQPLLINNIELCENMFTMDYLITNYKNFDIKLFNNTKNGVCVPITLHNFCSLKSSDTSGTYISYNNIEFLDETSLDKYLQTYDIFVRPYCSSNIKYDIIFGSVNSYTKLKYNIDHRTIIYMLEGEIEITLTPPKNYKYLHVVKNYENLDFYSDIDIYNVQDEYKKNFDKIKFLRIKLLPHHFLFLPPYWFYSIKILESNSTIIVNQYRTILSTMAIAPDLGMYFLQKNNIKLNTEKIISS